MSLPSAQRLVWGSLVLTILLTVLVYSSSFANGLLNWDDASNVTQNEAIRGLSWEHIRGWLTEPLLGMYTPLVYLSFAIDYRIGGLDPVIYHGTNLLLHVICVVLVFALIARLTGRATLAAVVAAAIFAVHPANVAAVTPISVRSSLLCSAFYLAAYVAYLTWTETRAWPRLAIAFALFVLAALSKPVAAVFPVLLMLTDYYRRRPLSGAALLEKLPFFAVAIATGVATLLVRDDIATPDPLRASALERVALAAYQLVEYGLKAVLPIGLSPFHAYPDRLNGALPALVWAAPVIVAGTAVLVFRAKSLRRLLVFCLGFFVLHLALVLKVVPLGEEFIADRYLYLPMAGLCLLAVELFQRTGAGVRRAAAVIGVAVVAVFSVSSYARSTHWRDDITFATRILERYPRSSTALANRAAARLQAGDVAGAWQDSTDAIRWDSSNARAYFNRATAGMLAGRPSEAMADAARAIALDPRLPAAYELRAQARLNTGDFTGARDDAARAIELDPDAPEIFKSFVTRGLARAMLEDRDGALADLDRAVALEPDEPALLLNRGQVRASFGDIAGGCRDLREALARGRDDARAQIAQWCGGAA